LEFFLFAVPTVSLFDKRRAEIYICQQTRGIDGRSVGSEIDRYSIQYVEIIDFFMFISNLDFQLIEQHMKKSIGNEVPVAFVPPKALFDGPVFEDCFVE